MAVAMGFESEWFRRSILPPACSVRAGPIPNAAGFKIGIKTVRRYASPQNLSYAPHAMWALLLAGRHSAFIAQDVKTSVVPPSVDGSAGSSPMRAISCFSRRRAWAPGAFSYRA